MVATTEADLPSGIADYMEVSGPVDGLDQRLDQSVLARLGNYQRLQVQDVMANNT